MKNRSEKKFSKADYLQYLRGNMSGKEAHELEKASLSDPFDSDALEGLSDLDPDLLENDLKSLQFKLDQRAKRKQIYLRLAASIVIALSVSLWLFWPQEIPLEQLAENKSELNQEQALQKQDIVIEKDQEKEKVEVVKEIPATEKPKVVEEQKTKPITQEPEIATKAAKNEVAELTLDFDVTSEDEVVTDAIAGQTLSRAAPSAAKAYAIIEAPQITWEVTRYFAEKITENSIYRPAQAPNDFNQKIQSTISGLNLTKNGQIEFLSRLSKTGEMIETQVLRSYNQAVDSILVNAVSSQKDWLPASVDGTHVDSEIIFKIKIVQ